MQLIGPDREKYADDKGNKNLKFTCRRGASQLERLCQLYILPATEGRVCQLQREGYASNIGKGMSATEGRICQLEREGYASYRGKDMPAT